MRGVSAILNNSASSSGNQKKQKHFFKIVLDAPLREIQRENKRSAITDRVISGDDKKAF